MGWLPMSFLKGKKLVVFGLGGLSVVLVLGPWGNSIESSFSASWVALGNLSKFLPADPPSGRLPSLSIAWEVCHKSDLPLTLPLNQGESNQGSKPLKPGDALKDGCPKPIQFPYLPSIVGIAPGSVCLMLSHCCNVHPRLTTHHPRLYPYWSSTLTCQDNLAKI